MDGGDDDQPDINGDGHLKCFHPPPITSAGYWFHDDPLKASLPLLMLQISVIVSLSRALHFCLRRLGMPVYFSHMLAGILLGPSALGRHRFFSHVLFPLTSYVHINTVGFVGSIFFLFMNTVKADLRMLSSTGKKAVVIALAGSLVSLVAPLAASHYLEKSSPTELQVSQLLPTIAMTWVLSGYSNISRALEELNLLNSKLGRLAMSMSLIASATNLIVRSVLDIIVMGRNLHSMVKAWGTFFTFVAMIVVIVCIIRPIAMWVIRKTPEGRLMMNEFHFVVIILLALLCAFFSEVIGHHGPVGLIIFGLALPSGPPLGTTLVERMEGIIDGLYLPVYFAMPGVRAKGSSITVDMKKWGYVQLCLLLSVLGKLIGTIIPALYCKIPFNDALSVGLMMCFKGFFEIDILNKWSDQKIVDDQSNAVILFTIVAVTGVVGPLLKILYNPTTSYVESKKIRTIQHAKRNTELHIMACVHNQANVSPIINLMDALYPTKNDPICIYVLHLVGSVGRNDAVLVPYDKSTAARSADTFPIVNAFRYSEQQNHGCASVQPFISISPYATMHEDVCTMALDKKVLLVIIPFHKQMAIDGTMESVNPAYQIMNINVLKYAPCSVGILIDHGLFKGITNFSLSDQMQRKIGVYFLGGSDDQEALACAARMLNNPTVHLTVIRFRLPEGWRDHGKDEQLDDEMLSEFRLKNISNDRVIYREEVVGDGEAMVSIIRKTSGDFSLLIVGRREGIKESPLTAGLSNWSECPELGIIGDMLASTDFGCKVSTLVVQQQTNARGAKEADSRKHHGEAEGEASLVDHSKPFKPF